MTNEERETAKAAILDALNGDDPITLLTAARRAGVNRSTCWRWRDDPAFDQALREALEFQDGIRVERVEETLFERLMNGKASGVEMIFFLCNRAPDRWRHVKDAKPPEEPDPLLPAWGLHARPFR